MRFKETMQASIGRRPVVKSGSGSIARMYPKVKVRVQDLDDQDDDLSFSWSVMTSPGEYQADSPKCIIRVPAAQLPKQEIHPIQELKVVDQKHKKSEETDRLSTRSSSVTRPRAVLSSPDNDEMIGSNNSKKEIEPSPLQNQNMVVTPISEHKITPLHPAATKTLFDNDKKLGSKNSKRSVQPSPLRNHNIVQNRHVEHKIIPLQTTTDTPSSTRRKPACVVNDHTPSTTSSLRSLKGKPKTVKDQTLTKSKQSGIITSSQKVHLKTHKTNSII